MFAYRNADEVLREAFLNKAIDEGDRDLFQKLSSEDWEKEFTNDHVVDTPDGIVRVTDFLAQENAKFSSGIMILSDAVTGIPLTFMEDGMRYIVMESVGSYEAGDVLRYLGKHQPQWKHVTEAELAIAKGKYHKLSAAEFSQKMSGIRV